MKVKEDMVRRQEEAQELSLFEQIGQDVKDVNKLLLSNNAYEKMIANNMREITRKVKGK